MATTEDPADSKPADPPSVAPNPAPAAAPTPPTPVPAPAPAAATDAPASGDALRAEFAEIAAVAALAARLGVTIDAPDAMKRSIKPDALRRSVLDALAIRSEASTIVATAPAQPSAGASPIVQRARERAAAGKH